MTIDHFCIRTVDTARADESVWTVAERMHQRSVGALVVVNDSHEPIGIITDRDLVERVLVKRHDADETPVGKIMTPNHGTSPPTADALGGEVGAPLMESSGLCCRAV